MVKAALFSLTGPRPAAHPDCGSEGRDPREHSTRLWDALVEASQRLLDAQVLPEAHGRKPRVEVTVRYADLLTGLGESTLATGEALSAWAVRRLACDAEVIPVVLGSQGEVLDVGRTARLVTGPIWTALVVRDRHCAFPGCRRPPIACDAHHIRHWVDGGATSLDNMILLCGVHHTMVHETPWEIRLDPVDRRPLFLPPLRLDPLRRPVRDRFAREERPPPPRLRT